MDIGETKEVKKQILVIHGGDTFASANEYLEFLRTVPINFEKMTRLGWKENLRTDLGESYEVILPQLPNKTNARYEEWVIMLEKIFPFLRDGIILVGHSMGGCFLAKYLAENDFPLRVKATYLVAAPFGNNLPEYELLSFLPLADLTGLSKQAGQITILQSEDDPLVPATDAHKYAEALPGARLVTFSDRGHFGQERFPELVELLRA